MVVVDIYGGNTMTTRATDDVKTPAEVVTRVEEILNAHGTSIPPEHRQQIRDELLKAVSAFGLQSYQIGRNDQG
jgi:hypothetical protein